MIGDIPPVNILDSRDIRATGATSINDLLDALAPQIGSAQGRGGEAPVFITRNVPVPKVHFAMPGLRQAWPTSAAC